MALPQASEPGGLSQQQNAKNEAFLGQVKGVISAVYAATTSDGYLAAAGRQGIGELGQALKAFPDAIQEIETGTLFNPTPGEVASQRSVDRSIYGEDFVKGVDRGEQQMAAGKKADFLKDILNKLGRKEGGNPSGDKPGYERAKERSLGDEQKVWRNQVDEQRGTSGNEQERPGGRGR